MYEDRRRGRAIIWIVSFIIFALLFSLIGNQLLQVFLNISEFGDLYIRPFFFSYVGGLILAVIAFVRFNVRDRKSLTLWALRTFLASMRGGLFHPRLFNFERFRLQPTTFVMWQITKVLIGSLIMSNALFGMTLIASVSGWDSGLQHVPGIFTLPFTAFEQRSATGAEVVIKAAPALTLLIPPILSAIGIRLILLIGLTQIIKVITHTVISFIEKGVATIKTSTIEALISLGLAWTGFNIFFSNYINFNTKIFITAAFVTSAIFALFAYWDSRKMPVMRNIYLRAGALILIALAVASAVTIQNSIADAQKLEWQGPYVSQEIAVNRYLARLDDIKIMTYNFSLVTIPPENIDSYIESNMDILSRVRLWDWDAAFAKLKPEIGLIPYVQFEDSDILRFNDTLYWSASMKPVLPPTVTAADLWYNEHLVYTHIPEGFLMLNAHTGDVVDPGLFFRERRIYYGEGGADSLFSTTWAAIIEGKETSDEIGGVRYDGRGGVKVSPPLSWIFDITFFLSYPDRTIHLLRYRDVHERVQLVLPYFAYRWQDGKLVDMLPVTNGERANWLVPLIVALKTDNLPWSRSNPFTRLLGFALVDAYDGTIKIIVTGNDFFSQLFKTVYSDYITTDVPEWLRNQIRYPAELFRWRVEMFNIYHVTDPATFIQAREFYEVPQGLSVYYIMEKPQGFSKMEFLGLLSLEVRGAQGRNLAGYIVVRNDYPYTGEMIFYAVPPESETKLLGPTAARQALERDPDFRVIKTLLTTDPENPPRIGERILYNIGQHPVYIIPVYTAPAGAAGQAEGVVVTQIGTVAAVGAAFTGQYFVGLGDSVEEAFRNFLFKLAGASAPEVKELTFEERIEIVLKHLKDSGLRVEEPEEINANLVFFEGSARLISEGDVESVKARLDEFVQNWVTERGLGRVLYWLEGDSLNVGAIMVEDGVVVLRYMTIILG